MDMTIIDTPAEALRIARVASINAHEIDACELMEDLHSSMEKDASAPAYLEKDKRRAMRRKKTLAKKQNLLRKAKVSLGGIFLSEKENGDKFFVRNHHSPKFNWNRYTNRIVRHTPIPTKEFMESDIEIPSSELMYHKDKDDLGYPILDFENMGLNEIKHIMKPDFPSFPVFKEEDFEEDFEEDYACDNYYYYDWY